MQILFEHSRKPVVSDAIRLGEGIWWEDGDSGIVDFHVSDGDDVRQFADRPTDGIDEVLLTIVLASRGGAGGGNYESACLKGSPDLVGNEIDFIRMIVHDVSIVPYTDPFDPDPLDGIMWDVDLTYEF